MAALPGLLAVHHVNAALHSLVQLESAPFLQQLKPLLTPAALMATESTSWAAASTPWALVWP